MQCRFDVGTPSAMLVQQQNNIGPISRISREVVDRHHQHVVSGADLIDKYLQQMVHKSQIATVLISQNGTDFSSVAGLR